MRQINSTDLSRSTVVVLNRRRASTNDSDDDADCAGCAHQHSVARCVRACGVCHVTHSAAQ